MDLAPACPPQPHLPQPQPWTPVPQAPLLSSEHNEPVSVFGLCACRFLCLENTSCTPFCGLFPTSLRCLFKFHFQQPLTDLLTCKIAPSGCFNQLPCFPPDYLIDISHTYVLICLLVYFCLLHWNVSSHEGRALSCLLLYL